MRKSNPEEELPKGDIITEVAAKVFDVEPEEVTPEMRFESRVALFGALWSNHFRKEVTHEKVEPEGRTSKDVSGS